jgi:hypothetical protein
MDLKWEICKKIIARLISCDTSKGGLFDDGCLKNIQKPKGFLDNYKRLAINRQGFILNYHYFWERIPSSTCKLIVIDGNFSSDECGDDFFMGQGDRENMLGKADLLLWPQYEGERGRKWNLYEFSDGKVLEKDSVLNHIQDTDLYNLFKHHQKSAFGFALFNKIPPVYFRSDLLDNCLKHYLGDDVLIPHNMEERARKFPTAFKDLKLFM